MRRARDKTEDIFFSTNYNLTRLIINIPGVCFSFVLPPLSPKPLNPLTLNLHWWPSCDLRRAWKVQGLWYQGSADHQIETAPHNPPPQACKVSMVFVDGLRRLPYYMYVFSVILGLKKKGFRVKEFRVLFIHICVCTCAYVYW